MIQPLNNSRILFICRIALLLYLILFRASPFRAELPEGVFSELYQPVGVFHVLPGPLSEQTLTILDWSWPVVLVLALFGVWTRPLLFACFVLGCYRLGYSYNFGRVFHANSLVLQILLWLSIAPAPTWRGSANPRPEEEELSRLALRVGQLIVCLVYFSAGVTKMVRSGFDWITSDQFAIRLLTVQIHTPLRDWVLQSPPWMPRLMAAFAMLLELASLLPWFIPRLAPLFMAGWFAMHAGIVLIMGGHATFLSHAVTYLFFLSPAWLPTRFFSRRLPA